MGFILTKKILQALWLDSALTKVSLKPPNKDFLTQLSWIFEALNLTLPWIGNTASQKFHTCLYSLVGDPEDP